MHPAGAEPMTTLKAGKYQFNAAVAVLRAKKQGSKKGVATHIRVTCRTAHKRVGSLQPCFFQFTHKLDAQARSFINGQKFSSRPLVGAGSFGCRSLSVKPPFYDTQITINICSNQDGALIFTLPSWRVVVGDESSRWDFQATFPSGWENGNTKSPVTVSTTMHVKQIEQYLTIAAAVAAAAAPVEAVAVKREREGSASAHAKRLCSAAAASSSDVAQSALLGSWSDVGQQQQVNFQTL
jgi:hypothetical protein